MSGKKTSSQVLEEIKQNIKAGNGHIDLEQLTVKISLRDMTQEERMQEASRPLYLRRYE